MKNKYSLIAIILIMTTHSFCKYKKNTIDNFKFNLNDYNIQLKASDSSYLIKRYNDFSDDRTDTLPWPLDVSSVETILMVDVSGTMFKDKFSVVKNGKEICFFDYSLAELSAYLRKNSVFNEASTVTIKLFGSKPRGLDKAIDESTTIIVPRGKLIVQEFFYPSDSRKIEISVTGYEKPDTYNIYDSVEHAIKLLAKPYCLEKSQAIAVKESPILENIVINYLTLQKKPGRKNLIYMTDGYFKIDGEQDLTPKSRINLQELKAKFEGLKMRIKDDPSFQYIFLGMNTVENLQFRDKLNGFYEWFLNSPVNNVNIINLR